MFNSVVADFEPSPKLFSERQHSKYDSKFVNGYIRKLLSFNNKFASFGI